MGRRFSLPLPRLRPAPARATLDRYRAAALRERFASPGCPLCSALAEKEQRALVSLLWEQVNDPITASRLSAARGFCWEHTWALVPAGAAVHSQLGTAIVLERLLRDAFQNGPDARALERWLRPRAPCPVCTWLGEAEESLLLATATLAQHDPALLLAQPGSLCRPHARALRTVLPDFPWPAWEARTAQAEASWSDEQRIAHRVGRRPWGLPFPDELPACCPACLEEPARPGRAWAWLRALGWSFAQDVPAELCLGHASLAPEPARWHADLAALLEDLAAFLAAHDYRFRGSLTPPQRTSWLRAIIRLVGLVPAAGPHERQSAPAV